MYFNNGRKRVVAFFTPINSKTNDELTRKPSSTLIEEQTNIDTKFTSASEYSSIYTNGSCEHIILLDSINGNYVSYCIKCGKIFDQVESNKFRYL